MAAPMAFLMAGWKADQMAVSTVVQRVETKAELMAVQMVDLMADQMVD